MNARPSTLKGLYAAVRVLWSELTGEVRRQFVRSFVLMICVAVLGAAAPLVFTMALDGFINSSSTQAPAALTPMMLIVLFVVSQYLSNAISELRTLVHGSAIQQLQMTLSARLFRHILRLPLRLHLERKSGAIGFVQQQGLNGFQTLLQHVFFTLMPVAIELIAISAILIHLDHAVYLAIFAVSALCYLAAFTYGAVRVIEPARSANAAFIEAHATLTDSLLNYETVKYFGAESAVSERYEALLERTKRHYVQLFRTYMINGQLAALISGLCLGTTLLCAGHEVLAGTLTVGGFTLMNTYATRILQPIELIGSAMRDLSQAVANCEKMLEILREEPEQNLAKGSRSFEVVGEVKYDGVSFGYLHDALVLRDVSFTIEAGKTLAIVGRSGSGKSTIVRVLFGLFSLKKGQILIDGVPITEMDTELLRNVIGIVPQDTILFNDTIAYNIDFGKPGSSQEEIEQAAKIADLHDFIMTLPDKYQTQVGERGIRLSGGEKQRVSIARLALRRPRIFVYDEATSSLDTYTERRILRNLQELSDACTTLVIAHRLSTITHADLIVVLEKGVIVERGTHAQLVRNPNGKYARMWAKQARAVRRRRLDKSHVVVEHSGT